MACMRGKGIADMVDPIPGDTSGRSAVRYMLDVWGKGTDSMVTSSTASSPAKPVRSADEPT